jgi:Uma2 family endonuclease
MLETALLLTDADDGMELSREEFGEAEFDSRFRFERVHGRLVIMAPSGLDHHLSSEPFRDALVAYKLAHPKIVEYVFQESWTAIEGDTDRIADLAVFLRTNVPRPEFPHWTPDIVFEIVSSGWQNRRRDYQEKRDEYEKLGVPEYVIVDRFDHLVTVLTLSDGRYVEQRLGPNDSYSTPRLPGLLIPLQGVIGS